MYYITREYVGCHNNDVQLYKQLLFGDQVDFSKTLHHKCTCCMSTLLAMNSTCHSHLRVQHGFLQPCNPLSPVSGNPFITQSEETIKLLFCKTTSIDHRITKVNIRPACTHAQTVMVWPDKPLIPGRCVSSLLALAIRITCLAHHKHTNKQGLKHRHYT